MVVKSTSTGEMGRGGHRWKQLCRLVYETYGPICHICEHPVPGGVDGGQVDHVIAVCERPDLAFMLENLRPIHGGRQRCPECGHRCNQVRQARPVEYARRKVQTPVPGFHPAPVPARKPGRDWLAISPELPVTDYRGTRRHLAGPSGSTTAAARTPLPARRRSLR